MPARARKKLFSSRHVHPFFIKFNRLRKCICYGQGFIANSPFSLKACTNRAPVRDNSGDAQAVSWPTKNDRGQRPTVAISG